MNTRNGSFHTLVWRRGAWLGLLAAIGLTLGLLALTTGPARADYPGHGPDENTSEAYGPLQGAHTYSATLNNSGSNPNDQDWYYFYVPTAGDKLQWTVSNTSSGCTPRPQSYYCHVYATLENANGQQVGGSNSSAGTSGALPGQTQYINWTFSSPGRYYIAFIGDGDVLSYSFRVTPASGVSSCPLPTGATSTLKLGAHQNRRYVDFSFDNPRALSCLSARLYMRSGGSWTPAGQLRRTFLPKGKAHYAIRLSSGAWSRLKSQHRLTVDLHVKLELTSGRVLRASRKLVLTHP